MSREVSENKLSKKDELKYFHTALDILEELDKNITKNRRNLLNKQLKICMTLLEPHITEWNVEKELERCHLKRL